MRNYITNFTKFTRLNESDESEWSMPPNPQLISKESKTETFDEMVFRFPEERLEFIIRVYDDGYSTFHFGDGIQIDTSYSNDEYLDEYKKYHDSILSELGMEDTLRPWRRRNED